MGRLSVLSETSITSQKELVSTTLVYDKCIYKAMILTYSAVANLLGDQLFSQLDEKMITRALQVEEREGFTFSEMATLACLYMAINKSAVEVLNKPAETDNQKKRLKGRMRLIKTWLFSQEYRDSLFRALADLLALFNEKEYTLLMESHCRDYWLPEDKQGLKYIDYAMRKHSTIKIEHKGKVDEIPVLRLRLPPIDLQRGDTDVTMKQWAEIMRKCRSENMQVKLYQEFFHTILPVAEWISDGTIPKRLLEIDVADIEVQKIDLKPYILASEKRGKIIRKHVEMQDSTAYVIDRTVYRTAEKIAAVLDAYIDAVIASVGDFLSCLPETAIAGNVPILEYLKKI